MAGEAGGQAGLEGDTETLTLARESRGSRGWEMVLFGGICGSLQLVS